MSRFTACTQDKGAAALVAGNISSGERLGVSATPAFFVNGRFMPGAQPFEAFQRVIDDELKNTAQPAANQTGAHGRSVCDPLTSMPRA